MPTYARKHQLQHSLVYHIFNRGNAKLAVFHAADDYLYFTKLIREYIYKFSIKVYHWAIMPNHYHLLAELEEPGYISKFMAGLNRAYTCYYHRMYKTAGFLWQGRFKCQPVQRERYLISCGRYIERNPVKAGFVLEAADYPYSSAKFYCLGENDDITTEDPAFREFGAGVAQRRLAYKEFLRNFNSEEEKSFSGLEGPQGDKEFLRKLIKVNGRYVPRRQGRTLEIFVT